MFYRPFLILILGAFIIVSCNKSNSENSSTTQALKYFGKTVVFFGNSITAGSGATDTSKRFTNVLSKMLGTIQFNIGRGGMYLQKQHPLSSMGAKFSMDSASLIPFYDTTYSFLVVELGTNDVLFNGSNYTVDNYKKTYDSLITYIIAVKKYPIKKIILLSPSFLSYNGRKYSDLIYNTYPTWQGMPTIQRELDFNQATADVSAKWGILYVKIYDEFISHGDSSLLFTDGIHPNDAGHFIYAQSINKNL